jgi:probable HAF family extracellular repeat protein
MNRALAGAVVGLGLVACSGNDASRATDEVDKPAERVQTACVGGYTVTDLTALGGAQVGYIAYGVSPSGAVTGAARPSTDFAPLQVMTWTAATGLSAIGSLGGDPAQGNAINDAGQIAGTSYLTGDTDQHAFFYDPTTGYHDLGSFGGTGSGASMAFGLNASGTVAGYASFSTGFRHAFTWSGSSLVDLGTTASGFNSAGYAINNAGLVVGEADGFDGFVHAAAWPGGVLTDLGALGGTSQALAVNSAGIAVGQASGPGISWLPVAFHDGIVDPLALPDNYDKAIAHGISDSGQIVGEAWPSAASGLTRHHAFVSQAGATFDLNDLVTDHSVELSAALAINSAGQIAGQGFGAADGVIHAVVLTPVACGGTRGFVDVSTDESGTGTIAVPDGVVAGDVLVAVFEVDADPVTVAPPIGWTQVRDQRAGSGATAFHAIAYTHTVTTTEPTTYAFTAPDGVWIGGQIAAYHGVTGVDAAASASATGTHVSAPSVTTSHASDLLVTAFVDFDGGTWSTPSAMTRRSDFDGNSLDDAVVAAAGASGAKVATDTSSSALAAITIALH